MTCAGATAISFMGSRQRELQRIHGMDALSHGQPWTSDRDVVQGDRPVEDAEAVSSTGVAWAWP